MNKHENYGLISPHELEEHPLRKEVFLAAKSEFLDAYKESKERVGKVLPVIYVEEGLKKLVIDGFKHVMQSRENNEEFVFALKVEVAIDEIPQLMIELHRNYHQSIQEEHKMCALLFDKLSLGKGFRSDVIETEENQDPDNLSEATDSQASDKKRRPTVYDKIGKIMGVTANRVKHLLKVGKVNPWYFDRIEKDRTSLYAAYCKCKEEEKGIEQKVPSVRDTVYVSSNTGTPEFGSESKTFETPFIYTEPDSEPIEKHITSTAVEGGTKSQLVYSVQKQICPHCGEIFEFITPKSNEV